MSFSPSDRDFINSPEPGQAVPAMPDPLDAQPEPTIAPAEDAPDIVEGLNLTLNGAGLVGDPLDLPNMSRLMQSPPEPEQKVPTDQLILENGPEQAGESAS